MGLKRSVCVRLQARDPACEPLKQASCRESIASPSLLAQNLKMVAPSGGNSESWIGHHALKFNRYRGGETRVKPCNLHIINTLKLTNEMIGLADRGDADREDNGCGILYGVLRDSAFKLKKLAEEEKLNHIRKGWWQEKQ